MSDRNTLTQFFEKLSSNPEADIWTAFFEEILLNDQVYAEKEPSLLAIHRLWQYSNTGEKVAEILIELDHFRLWDSVEFQGENDDDREAVFVKAKDIESAYQIGFKICSHTRPDEAGFVQHKEDGSYSRIPSFDEISEEEGLELGLNEDSPEESWYKPICLLRFWWDDMI